MSSLLEKCKANLKSYEKSGWDQVFSRNLEQFSQDSAAVLISLFIKEGQIHVLLTQRSKNVRTHKGQVSFPGGKKEHQDSNYIETALREATEEVGICPKHVEVVSTTWKPQFVGRENQSRLPVYPVVGVLKPGFKVVSDNDEVAEVFDVPLEFFLEDKTHRDVELKYSSSIKYTVHNFEYFYEPTQTIYHIWGLTGILCLKVAIIALKRLPSFELKSENEMKAFEGFVLNKPKNAQLSGYSSKI